jgi:hypothetical protein
VGFSVLQDRFDSPVRGRSTHRLEPKVLHDFAKPKRIAMLTDQKRHVATSSSRRREQNVLVPKNVKCRAIEALERNIAVRLVIRDAGIYRPHPRLESHPQKRGQHSNRVRLNPSLVQPHGYTKPTPSLLAIGYW